jgi:hypothetical protein
MHFSIRQHTAQDDSHLLKINSCSISHIQYSMSVPACKKTSLHNKRSQNISSLLCISHIQCPSLLHLNKKFIKKYFFIHVFPRNIFTVLLFSWRISAAITTNRMEILCLFQTLIVTYKTKNVTCTAVTSNKTNMADIYMLTERSNVKLAELKFCNYFWFTVYGKVKKNIYLYIKILLRRVSFSLILKWHSQWFCLCSVCSS